jgi:hypothetical protein
MYNKMNIAIIGSAVVSNTDRDPFIVYTNTVKKVDTLLTEIDPEWSFTLVSGGAALCDHITVTLFNMHREQANLELYLPCEFYKHLSRFEDNGKYQWTANPGKTANNYHVRFRKMVGIDSLGELATVVSDPRCKVDISDGFHERTRKVAANCDVIIGFSWGNEIEGGTKYTWDACKLDTEHRFHFRL